MIGLPASFPARITANSRPGRNRSAQHPAAARLLTCAGNRESLRDVEGRCRFAHGDKGDLALAEELSRDGKVALAASCRLGMDSRTFIVVPANDEPPDLAEFRRRHIRDGGAIPFHTTLIAPFLSLADLEREGLAQRKSRYM